VITSTANPRVKALAKLKDRSARRDTGTFPIEGLRTVDRAFSAGWPLADIVVAPEVASQEHMALAKRIEASGVALTELGATAFARIANRRHPDGILAVGRTRRLTLEQLDLTLDPLLLIVDAVEKPGNLGAILRTADAAGVDAVIAADPATDLFNPNVVRASQGALFTVPTAVATAAAVAGWLAGLGVMAVAASPRATVPPWDVDLTGGRAIVVGSEHAGVSAAWTDALEVQIPMRGSGDSLNAAIAAAVIIYEALRQRG
jgi:TrmH family RNA methyltransferase